MVKISIEKLRKDLEKAGYKKEEIEAIVFSIRLNEEDIKVV